MYSFTYQSSLNLLNRLNRTIPKPALTIMEANFFQKVYDVARLIPYGKVTSYGAIARFCGSPQAARMVGWAMNKSSSQKKFVPAHRVLNRNGMLSGKNHFGGPNTMKELLESEGHIIIDDQLVDFKKCFWDPMKELDF